MKICLKCEAQNPGEAKFCYNCGQPFVEKKPMRISEFLLLTLFLAIIPGFNILLLTDKEFRTAGFIGALVLALIIDFVIIVVIPAIF